MSKSKDCPKVCLLGSSFGTDNFGVNVLALGTIRALLSAWPEACISIMDYAREPRTYRLLMDSRELEVPLVNMRFSKKPWQPNHIVFLLVLAGLARLAPTRGIRTKLIQSNSSLGQLDQMDLITAISGGDSFSDIYGMMRFIYVALPQILAILLGKKLVLLPQTLGPFRGRTTRSVTRFILRGADRIYTRDKLGFKTVEVLFGNDHVLKKVFFHHDVGFAVEPVKPDDPPLLAKIDGWKLRGPLLGLNVSGLLYMGGYTRNNMFGLATDYRQLTQATLKWFQDLNEGTLLLVPHVLGAENAESDVSVCKMLYQEWRPVLGDRLQILDQDLSEREVKFVIGKCDFFSGARMHACIAALSQLVPTVPIAYSAKFVGVMQTVGADKQVADPRTMAQQEILGLISTSYVSRNVIQRALQGTIPGVVESTLDLFQGLTENGLRVETTIKKPLQGSQISAG